MLATAAQAQDVIHKFDGQTIQAKNIVIGPTDIEYVRFDDNSGVIRMVPRAEVDKIVYKNGTVKKIQQPKKEKEVEIDRSKLWGGTAAAPQPQGEGTGGRGGAKRQARPAVQKFIFSAGYRYESIEENDIGADGFGAELSFPLGVPADVDTVKGRWAVSYRFAYLNGTHSYYYGGSPSISTDFDLDIFHNALTLDYRLRVARRSFLAPYAGLSLEFSSLTVYNSISTSYPYSFSSSQTEASEFTAGLTVGFEFVYRPLGVGLRYDSPTSGLLLGVNLAF